MTSGKGLRTLASKRRKFEIKRKYVAVYHNAVYRIL